MILCFSVTLHIKFFLIKSTYSDIIFLQKKTCEKKLTSMIYGDILLNVADAKGEFCLKITFSKQLTSKKLNDILILVANEATEK